MGIFDTANDTAHSSTAEVEQAVPARPAARLQTQQPASAQPVQAKSGPAGTAGTEGTAGTPVYDLHCPQIPITYQS